MDKEEYKTSLGEYLIAMLTALDDLFDRLNVPEADRAGHRAFFAYKIGGLQGKMVMTRIQKQAEEFAENEKKKLASTP